MSGGSTRAFWPWLLVSTGSHAAFVWLCLHGLQHTPARASSEETLWLETAPTPEPGPVPQPDPRPPTPTPAPQPRPNTKVARAAPARPLQLPQEGTGLPLPAAEGEPSVTAVGERGEPGSSGSGTETPPAPAPAPPRPIAPQLSMWLALPELERQVIVRSPTALLAALPGYRDMLRGSEVQAFSNLTRLRVFLPGLAPDRLVLAGVHRGGEAELMQAAERVAKIRERVPKWRGDARLRATSWVDGSRVDRGLALHDDAFMIGARNQLPTLLGEDTSGDRVARFSEMRADALALLAVTAVERYVPALQPCALRGLRISVSAALHVSLDAEYENAARAADASTCLRQLPEATVELPTLITWLVRAAQKPGDRHTLVNIGVSREEVVKLFDELRWSLRRVVRG